VVYRYCCCCCCYTYTTTSLEGHYTANQKKTRHQILPNTDDVFVANFPVSVTVKELENRKSVNIWQSYGQEFDVLFFDSRCSGVSRISSRGQILSHIFSPILFPFFFSILSVYSLSFLHLLFPLHFHSTSFYSITSPCFPPMGSEGRPPSGWIVDITRAEIFRIIMCSLVHFDDEPTAVLCFHFLVNSFVKSFCQW